MLITDSNSSISILEDISYGYKLVYLTQVFLISSTLIVGNHLLLDFILDKTYGKDEEDLTRLSCKSAEGASKVLLSRSIRYIASAIIILGVMYFTS